MNINMKKLIKKNAHRNKRMNQSIAYLDQLMVKTAGMSVIESSNVVFPFKAYR